MRIAVTGSHGLIGTALVARLAGLGHDVVRMVRGVAGPDDITWDPAAGRLEASDLIGVDAVVNLAGAGIGDQRWTDEYKREIVASRTRATNLVAEAIAAVEGGPRVLISGSGVDYYGKTGDEELDERSPNGGTFLAGVTKEWEQATKAAEGAGSRVVCIRSGIVLAREGGALRRMLLPFKLAVGGRFGSGRQWMSWISLTDEVAAIVHLLSSEVHGGVNLTAPAPVRNREFADTLGHVLGRPTVLPAPAFALRALLGAERAEELLLRGQRVPSKALEADGFTFAHPDLETALRAELDR